MASDSISGLSQFQLPGKMREQRRQTTDAVSDHASESNRILEDGGNGDGNANLNVSHDNSNWNGNMKDHQRDKEGYEDILQTISKQSAVAAEDREVIESLRREPPQCGCFKRIFPTSSSVPYLSVLEMPRNRNEAQIDFLLRLEAYHAVVNKSGGGGGGAAGSISDSSLLQFIPHVNGNSRPVKIWKAPAIPNANSSFSPSSSSLPSALSHSYPQTASPSASVSFAPPAPPASHPDSLSFASPEAVAASSKETASSGALTQINAATSSKHVRKEGRGGRTGNNSLLSDSDSSHDFDRMENYVTINWTLATATGTGAAGKAVSALPHSASAPNLPANDTSPALVSATSGSGAAQSTSVSNIGEDIHQKSLILRVTNASTSAAASETNSSSSATNKVTRVDVLLPALKSGSHPSTKAGSSLSSSSTSSLVAAARDNGTATATATSASDVERLRSESPLMRMMRRSRSAVLLNGLHGGVADDNSTNGVAAPSPTTPNMLPKAAVTAHVPASTSSSSSTTTTITSTAATSSSSATDVIPSSNTTAARPKTRAAAVSLSLDLPPATNNTALISRTTHKKNSSSTSSASESSPKQHEHHQQQQQQQRHKDNDYQLGNAGDASVGLAVVPAFPKPKPLHHIPSAGVLVPSSHGNTDTSTANTSDDFPVVGKRMGSSSSSASFSSPPFKNGTMVLSTNNSSVTTGKISNEVEKVLSKEERQTNAAQAHRLWQLNSGQLLPRKNASGGSNDGSSVKSMSNASSTIGSGDREDASLGITKMSVPQQQIQFVLNAAPFSPAATGGGGGGGSLEDGVTNASKPKTKSPAPQLEGTPEREKERDSLSASDIGPPGSTTILEKRWDALRSVPSDVVVVHSSSSGALAVRNSSPAHTMPSPTAAPVAVFSSSSSSTSSSPLPPSSMLSASSTEASAVSAAMSLRNGFTVAAAERNGRPPSSLQLQATDDMTANNAHEVIGGQRQVDTFGASSTFSGSFTSFSFPFPLSATASPTSPASLPPAPSSGTGAKVQTPFHPHVHSVTGTSSPSTPTPYQHQQKGLPSSASPSPLSQQQQQKQQLQQQQQHISPPTDVNRVMDTQSYSPHYQHSQQHPHIRHPARRLGSLAFHSSPVGASAITDNAAAGNVSSHDTNAVAVASSPSPTTLASLSPAKATILAPVTQLPLHFPSGGF